MNSTLKNNVHKLKTAMAAACIAVAGGAVPVAQVFADEPTVTSSGTDTYTTNDGSTGTWSDSNNNGKVTIGLDTTGGSFVGPNGDKHGNGAFIVSIPSAIKYTGMNAGAVDVTKSYDVTVYGTINANQAVKITASSGNELTDSDSKKQVVGSVTETTTMNDAATQNTQGAAYSASNGRTFSKEQCEAMDASSGNVIGTTVKDSVSLKGVMGFAGTYQTVVTYTASLINK